MTQRRTPQLRLPEAHLRQDRLDITPASDRGRAFPIGDPARPRSDLEAIVAYLDVEASPRYRAGGGRTYCNVYACDYCSLAGVYLPRVWWTDDALGRIAAGERVGVSYGKTVRELSANALYDWLEKHGIEFGWSRAADLDRLQTAANEGRVAVIVAQRRDRRRSGHIAVVIPERLESPARRQGERVVLPLQSQAGRVNRSASTGASAWWEDDRFHARAFWTNRPR